ncbi:MAG: Uma2 family endonuclease [Cyanophyceae cyanobacterium]
MLNTYPDVLLIQDQPIFQEQRRDTVLNPGVIVEILSKSTRDYDRTTKFRYERSILDFQADILIDQYEAAVAQYIRTDESWLYRGYEGNTPIKSATVNVEMSFQDIYEKVNFNGEDGKSTL